MTKPSPKRMAVWNHNGLIGSTELACSVMDRIMTSPTANAEAKRRAKAIYLELKELKTALKERVDDREYFPATQDDN